MVLPTSPTHRELATMLFQRFLRCPSMRLVAGLKESVSDSSLAGASGSSNPMDIVFNHQWEGVTNDGFHVRNVQSPRRHIGRNKPRTRRALEIGQGGGTILLILVGRESKSSATHRDEAPVVTAWPPSCTGQQDSVHFLGP
jgi:hypothetical protein